MPAFLAHPLSAFMTPLLMEDEAQVECYVLPDPVRDLARLRKRAAQTGGGADGRDVALAQRLAAGERVRDQDLSGEEEEEGAESGPEAGGGDSDDSLEGPAKDLYEELLMRAEVAEAGTLRDHSMAQEQEGELSVYHLALPLRRSQQSLIPPLVPRAPCPRAL